MKNEDLIVKILDKQLKIEVENILSITKQGFDVFIHIEFPELITTLKGLLEQETQINPRIFRVITDSPNISIKHSQDLEFAFIPTILIGNHTLEYGTGFVRYSLQSSDKLIGHVANAISEILDYFKITKYLDCFDAKIYTKLKEIAKISGVRCLIDAVIQTAYLAGFTGNQLTAYQYLDTFNVSAQLHKNDTNISMETCAKRFLSYCISQGDNPFDFLKSSLSFYVVSQQGQTMTRASQILGISRTTLMEHLKTAEKVGVSTFFEHGTR